MSIEQELQQFLQPHRQNVEEFGKVINDIILARFPDIKENYEPMIDVIYDTLLLETDRIKIAKEAFIKEEEKTIIPQNTAINYWKWNLPLHKDLFDSIYADTITKGDDEWHVSLSHYQEYIHAMSQVFSLLPGSRLNDETYINFYTRTPPKELVSDDNKNYVIRFEQGTFRFDFNNYKGSFIATIAPNAIITTELKTSFGSKTAADFDTIHFKISELGSGALDAILYAMEIQKL
ncbi:MAG: hypothetical protein WC916_01020 [Candidatus Woesearchaeota archaeon]